MKQQKILFLILFLQKQSNTYSGTSTRVNAQMCKSIDHQKWEAHANHMQTMQRLPLAKTMQHEDVLGLADWRRSTEPLRIRLQPKSTCALYKLSSITPISIFIAT